MPVVVVAALAATALMLPASPAAAAPRCGAAADAGTYAAPASERGLALLCLVNRVRARHDRRALRFDWLLATAAYWHAFDMVGRGYFSHITPEGAGVADRARAVSWVPEEGPWSLGEVLAFGCGASASPRAALRAWLVSPTHRSVVLSRRLRSVGLGLFDFRGGGACRPASIWVLDAGRRG